MAFRKDNNDMFMSLLTDPENNNLVPMTRDSTKKGTKVVDLTKGERAGRGFARGASQYGRSQMAVPRAVGKGVIGGSKFLGNQLAGFAKGVYKETTNGSTHGSGQGVQRTPRGQSRANMGMNSEGIPNALARPDMGVGEDGVPNSLRRPDTPQGTGGEQDPVVQALSGDKYEEATRALQEGMGTEVAGDNLWTNPNKSVREFAGSMIENVTPRGVPEPEEIGGLGKALSTFSKALETPGFQRFLSEMGIAFSGGREGAPGTVLGQANIQKLDADAEAEVMQRLLAGESLEDIDMSMIRNPETVRAATQVAGQQQEMRMAEEGQEFDQEFQLERLRQFDEQLGLQDERLDLDWYRALSERMRTQANMTKPDGVGSVEHGHALRSVASADIFKQTALDAISARAEELGLSSIQEIQQVLQGDDGYLDPYAVRMHLPAELQDVFDEQVNQMSQSVSRSYRNIDEPAVLDYRPGPMQVGSPDEVEALPVGTLFRTPNGVTAIRTQSGFRRLSGQSTGEDE